MNLKEVARAAGVSPASASRALRGGQGISASLRMRVLAAADRLGYQPNLAARALASRSRLVGIILTDPCDSLLGAIARALASALAAEGIRSFVTWSSSGEAGTHGPDGRTVGGLVWVGGRPTPSESPANTIPRIGISDRAQDSADIIDLGRTEGCALACRYLAAQGHDRISVLAAPDMLATDRFVDALGDASASLEAVGAGLPGVRTSLGRMRQGQGPTAIVCDSDVTALAMLQGCAAEGLAVPRQASVVGFGDEPFGRYSVPALTTVRVPVDRIGALAAKAIVGLASRRDPSFTPPPAKLVLRQSSGAAP